MKLLKAKVPLCLSVLACAALAQPSSANASPLVDPDTPEGVLPYSGQSGWELVFSDEFNGDFNANPGEKITFAETDHWYNTKGQQSQVATRADKSYDGSQNGTLTSSRGFGVDTGYTIGEGDRFDFSYVWQDDWNWVDASDQVTVALFVTADNTITGTRTDLLVDAPERVRSLFSSVPPQRHPTSGHTT